MLFGGNFGKNVNKTIFKEKTKIIGGWIKCYLKFEMILYAGVDPFPLTLLHLHNILEYRTDTPRFQQ